MEQLLQQAVEILLQGGLIAYPTDTVYGLGVDAYNEEAVAKVYQVKQRPVDQPLPLLLSDESGLNNLTNVVPDVAWRLMKRFWPGGLTLVVFANPSVPRWVTTGGDTVAVRVPNHPLTLKLIRKFGKPLIGTSANLSGCPSVTSAEEVRDQLGDKLDFLLDGGVCPGGIESTVLDVTGKTPTILREGAVSHDEIAKVCNTPVRRAAERDKAN